MCVENQISPFIACVKTYSQLLVLRHWQALTAEPTNFKSGYSSSSIPSDGWDWHLAIIVKDADLDNYKSGLEILN